MIVLLGLALEPLEEFELPASVEVPLPPSLPPAEPADPFFEPEPVSDDPWPPDPVDPGFSPQLVEPFPDPFELPVPLWFVPDPEFELELVSDVPVPVVLPDAPAFPVPVEPVFPVVEVGVVGAGAVSPVSPVEPVVLEPVSVAVPPSVP